MQLCIIVNRMDQSKTNPPHVQSTKFTQGLWKFRTQLTGALLHTKAAKGKIAFGYYDILRWPHDCNLTINILLEILQELAIVVGRIPKVLYIQLDNCYRENKNQFFFTFVP